METLQNIVAFSEYMSFIMSCQFEKKSNPFQILKQVFELWSTYLLIRKKCLIKNHIHFEIGNHFQLWLKSVQVILFEINCTFFYANLHELFCQFISWTKWVNSCKFMDNCWISCQVRADMKKVYNNLIIINLYIHK